MVLEGKLQQIQLSQIFQSVEVREKTGLLTIIQGEQEVCLYFLQGRLMCISLQEHVPLMNRHFQGEVSGGKFYACTRKEAIEIVQNLLTWQSGKVYFDEGVQPPTDQFLIDLRITSLIPSLFGPISTSNLSINNPEFIIEEPTTPISVPATLFKSPRLMIEEASLPTPPPSLPTPPLPFLFKKSKPSTPVTSFPKLPNTSQSMLEKQVRPAIRLPQIFRPSVGLLSAARTILPLPGYDPTVKLSTPRQRYNSNLRWEVLLITGILLAAAFLHGVNMFHFPYYEDDEGTYMSQAWAVVHQGQLAYYTYWYDHAPLGWIQIAAWSILTGGFHTFGSAIASGRFLMLIMQVGATYMVYRIARSVSDSVTAAVIASLLFALSPYGIYYHRRVLLDNIATFWMLLSILLLVSGRLSLSRVWLSAVSLGISILSKEVTFFLIPILTYLVFYRADKSHRWFATIGWIALVGSVISLYVLMATLKVELFPSGTLLGGTAPHVSLLGTLQFQASRGKDGGFFDIHSGFWQQAKDWAQDDPVLVIAGSLGAILSVLILKTQRLVGVMGVASLSLWVFLARGGEIIVFYLVPLLPLLALNIGLVLGLTVNRLKTYLKGSPGIMVARTLKLLMVGLCLGSMLTGYTSSNPGLKSNSFLFWNGTQADAQYQATQWIEKNLPLSSHMIIDEYMWIDLYDSGYTSAHYYWKVQDDPAIRDKVFHNDWRNFDYVVTTPQLLGDAQRNHMTLVEEALKHSTLITSFDTGGWPVEIRKVNK